MRPASQEQISESIRLPWLASYGITPGGDVISFHKSPPQLRKLTCDRGYYTVCVHLPSGNRTLRVHRLVAEAFHGPPPPGMFACHNNGNPLDNRAENIRWDTHLSNMRDKWKHGTMPTGMRASTLAKPMIPARPAKIGNAKITHAVTDKVRKMLAEGKHKSEIARAIGICERSVYNIREGVTWKSVKWTKPRPWSNAEQEGPRTGHIKTRRGKGSSA